MKRTIQCVKIRLPDGREGEFWGQELVKNTEIKKLNETYVEVRFQKPFDVWMGVPPPQRIDPHPEAFFVLNRNREN